MKTILTISLMFLFMASCNTDQPIVISVQEERIRNGKWEKIDDKMLIAHATFDYTTISTYLLNERGVDPNVFNRIELLGSNSIHAETDNRFMSFFDNPAESASQIADELGILVFDQEHFEAWAHFFLSNQAQGVRHDAMTDLYGILYAARGNN